jgi:glycosyltransferase involved in cell wall biosynthesis
VRASVVVPTYRRPDLLGQCLEALARQDFPPAEYEIVVADDAASPDTRRQVEEFAPRSAPVVRYVPVAGRHGPAAARNAGWREARGAVVAFTDDDTVPEPGWVRAGSLALERDPALAAATGQVVVPLPPVPRDSERNEAGLETAEFVTANCFCRRSVLEALGGFDEEFRLAWREDSDLHFRLLEAGLKLVKVPDAVVVHPVRPVPWGGCLRQQKKCLYDALLYRKHPALFRRHIRPSCPYDYYGIVACALVLLAAVPAGMAWLALAALAGWAVLMGRFVARRLGGTLHTPEHVAEMLLTSLAAPFLSVFWRLYGAAKFRVWFF